PGVVLAVSAFGVVTQTRNLMTDLTPGSPQFSPRTRPNTLAVAIYFDHVAIIEAADDMRLSRQSCFPQDLQYRVAFRCRHLYDHAGLFGEQCTHNRFLSLYRDLLRPYLVVAPIRHLRVEGEHIDIQRNTSAPCESHFASGREQPSIRAIVVSQYHPLF